MGNTREQLTEITSKSPQIKYDSDDEYWLSAMSDEFVKQFEFCCKWLELNRSLPRGKVGQRVGGKRIRFMESHRTTYRSSYGLKHGAQDAAGFYISNTAMKCAMVTVGAVSPKDRGQNFTVRWSKA